MVSGLIAETSRGGRLLAVEGPPGIGKTALIGEAKALASDAGVQVLAARGSELERSFSYGVVRQLFEPFLASRTEEDRDELLGGSAALAGPIFDPAHVAAEPTADSSLAALHGLYWLTANAAARAPLLLVVDDLQWCDLPSLRFLGYLLPRLEELDALVVVGLRQDDPSEDPALLAQILSDPLATLVRPPPLTPEGTARLLRETLSADADDAFCRACWEETGGNPLLLRELLRGIADEGLIPAEENIPALHELGARAGARAVSLRLSRLPEAATALARAAAILGDDADLRQAAALAGLEEPDALDAVDALGRADVLRPQPPLQFVHPLIRSAVEESLSPRERDDGHSWAARLLADRGAEPERVAAHLLRTSPAADPRTAAMLRAAARSALSRGAPESAVAYLRRALDEPPPRDDRTAVLLELGTAETLVDGRAAVGHLGEAHALTEGPIPRARLALALGRHLFLLGRGESHRVYSRALDELGGADAELERLLEAGLIIDDLFAPSLHEAAIERLDQLRDRPPADTVGDRLLTSLLAYHDARAGSPSADVVPLARRALADGKLIAADLAGAFVPATAVLGMADLDEVLVVFEEALAEAHRQGSTFAFAAIKVFRAQVLVWRGDLADAEADAREAVAAGESWGASARFAGHAAAFLADALIEQGRLDEAAAALARVGLGESLPESARLLFLSDAGARLRIERGDLAGGAAEMLAAGRAFEAVGSRNPAFIAWRSPAALALQQLGQQAEARRLAAEEVELARTWGAPRALGAALRAAGVIEGGSRGIALLEEAVDVLKGSPAKLEHAKARAELGAALRRANRRADAREHLRHAVELATICGSPALASRAESDLLATGARPRRIALSGVASLTPSERRVAEMASERLTNREIAQKLFVTQRTVEVHLTSIYRKLAINSRSQLPAALAA